MDGMRFLATVTCDIRAVVESYRDLGFSYTVATDSSWVKAKTLHILLHGASARER